MCLKKQKDGPNMAAQNAASMWQKLFKNNANQPILICKLKKYVSFIGLNASILGCASNVIMMKTSIGVLMIYPTQKMHILHNFTIIPAKPDDDDPTDHFFALKGKGAHATVVDLPFPEPGTVEIFTPFNSKVPSWQELAATETIEDVLTTSPKCLAENLHLQSAIAIPAFITSAIYNEHSMEQAAALVLAVCQAINNYAINMTTNTRVGDISSTNIGHNALTTR